MTPAETFERAADLIDAYGWWQGKGGHGPDGQICALWALSDAAGSIVFLEVASALYRLGGLRASIPAWNDAPERTHAEVTSTFRAIAATLRAQADKTPTQERVTA